MPSRHAVVLGALVLLAVLVFLVPGLVGPYGAFIDELYYLSCARRLDWGYVDHPPLAPALLAVSRSVLGDGVLALRVPPALAGALVVGAIVLVARRLGAGPLGVAVAGAAALTAPVFQVLFGFYSMNAFEILLWTAMLGLLVEIEHRREPWLWWACGAVAGLAMLNKHTAVLLGVAVTAGLVITPARRHLRTPWPWTGLALAAVIFMPNVLWQIEQGWPSLEFYRNAALYKQAIVPWWQVALQQVLVAGPGTLPVWLAGLVLLARREPGRDLRHLAVTYGVLLVLLMASGQARPDRIAGVYPLLFAAGGAAFERLWRSGRVRWTAAALGAWLAVWAALLAPLGLPVFPPDTAARWAATLGVVPQIERGEGKRTDLPQWFADRLGWPELVADVAAVKAQLSPDERRRVVFFAPSYGQAGALEWLGADEELTPVYSTHNTWYLWGPPREPVEVAIVLGGHADRLAALFEQVEPAGIHDCGRCMPWRNRMPIWIVHRARVPIASIWADWKHFE